MRIRFGYVSTALSLWECSPSKTITFTNWQKLSKEERIPRLLELAKLNLHNTKRALMYNVAHEIDLYRLSSSIVPLATHPEVNWDYMSDLKEELKDVGDFVRAHKLRLSFHPNQYTLFTSDKKQVTLNAVKDMEYHYNILAGMGIEDVSLINIHVGGAYGDKLEAIKRFDESIQLLPSNVKSRMTLENDDKTYTTSETLAVCKQHSIPLMFDYHHHMANLSEESIEELLPAIFETWDNFGLIPKVHISSPKSEKQFRHHADYVDLEFVLPFLKVAKSIGRDFDMMIEAKEKDWAALKLVEDISTIRGIKRVRGGAVEWK